MAINCFQVEETLRLTPLAPERAVAASRDPEARIWLDLHTVDPAEVGAWLDRLAVAGLARQLCLEARDRPGFYPLKDETLLVIPSLSASAGSAEVDYVTFLCWENLLLSVRGRPFADPDRAAELEASDSWLHARSIAGLVSAVLMDESLDCLRRTAELRESALSLEERMDREPESVGVEEVRGLRSAVLALGAVLGDQLPILRAVSTADRPSLRFAGAREYMQCAVINLEAADASVDWLDQRAGALHSGLQMHAQEKTNRRLNMLTILSTIFMPVTMLTGLWGMNFKVMPELELPYAYPIALGFMALTGAGMYLFFRRTGWFE